MKLAGRSENGVFAFARVAIQLELDLPAIKTTKFAARFRQEQRDGHDVPDLRFQVDAAAQSPVSRVAKVNE